MFNTLRSENTGVKFSRKQMKNLLHRELGYGKNEYVVSGLCTGINPPIIKVCDGQYQFNDKPVHMTRLQQAFVWIATAQKKSNEKYRKEKTAETVTHVEQTTMTVKAPEKPEDEIEKAINLLKSNGYKIMAPKVVEYVEI